jgi:transposase-like protein
MRSSAHVTIKPALREPPAASKRRRYSIVEKRRMVDESFQPGASVARAARAHGVNADQVFGWRRLYQHGRLGGSTRTAQTVELLTVTISDAPAAPVPTPPATPSFVSPGRFSCNCPKAGCASKASWIRIVCVSC